MVCAGRSSRVRIWSEITAPDIVSSAKIMMTAIVLMGSTSLPIVAENVRTWRIFAAEPRNNHGRGAACAQPRYGASATQVQPERDPREAAKPSRHIGLVMTSQKQKRTAISPTLSNSRRFT